MVCVHIKVGMLNDREIDLAYFNVTALVQNIFRIQTVFHYKYQVNIY